MKPATRKELAGLEVWGVYFLPSSLTYFELCVGRGGKLLWFANEMEMFWVETPEEWPKQGVLLEVSPTVAGDGKGLRLP